MGVVLDGIAKCVADRRVYTKQYFGEGFMVFKGYGNNFNERRLINLFSYTFTAPTLLIYFIKYNDGYVWV